MQLQLLGLILPLGSIPAIAVETKEVAIDFADLEVGKVYKARFKS